MPNYRISISVTPEDAPKNAARYAANIFANKMPDAYNALVAAADLFPPAKPEKAQKD